MHKILSDSEFKLPRPLTKLGRGWYVNAGLSDCHALTKLHERPVGAVTGWQMYREHTQARRAANRLLHVLGNDCGPSRLAQRLDLRIDPVEGLPDIPGISHALARQRFGADGWLWLVGECLAYNGAYVALQREGSGLDGWEEYANWYAGTRREKTGNPLHIRFYLQL